MIKVANIMTVNPGKGGKALEFLKRAAEVNNKALPGINSTVLRPTTGRTGRLILVNTFESHQQREQFLKSQRDNPDWQAVVKESTDNECLLPGSLEQYIYDVL